MRYCNRKEEEVCKGKSALNGKNFEKKKKMELFCYFIVRLPACLWQRNSLGPRQVQKDSKSDCTY